MVFLGLLFVALRQQRQEIESNIPYVVSGVSPQNLEMPKVNGKDYWIPRNKRSQNINYFMAIFLLLFSLLVFFLLQSRNKTEFSQVVYYLLATLTVTFFLFYWTYLQNKMRLGISGLNIVLKDHQGVIARECGEKIVYSERGICINGIIVLLGISPMNNFLSEEFEQWIRPRLQGARYMTPKNFNKLMFKNRHWTLKLTLIMLVLSGLFIFGSRILN